MNALPELHERKRTAVLVVHGMGSQRPLDTVRGVVEAIWLGADGETAVEGKRRIWTHPERSGVDDIDLPVITTNSVPGTDYRQIDFHELYWAHLMSETRAVAVLLWLFELARMGPLMKPSIAALYFGALIFLSVLILSAVLLAVQFVVHAAWWAGRLSGVAFGGFADDLHSLIYVLLASIAVTSAFALVAAICKRSFKLASWCLALALPAVVLIVVAAHHETAVEQLTKLLLPIAVTALVILVAMGRWGIAGLIIVALLSLGAWALAVFVFHLDLLAAQSPWSIDSYWSSMAACLFIGVYLALYALFLQPYVGDAARYFRNSPGNVGVRREIRRQAVATLKFLHESGDYDRIVVAAHSLGTVVAYDMLRTYYSRINGALPDCSLLGQDFDAVDAGTLDKPSARGKGREVIGNIARVVDDARERVAAGRARPGDETLQAWLVTDFVTMGSPLTHALYLMCRGNRERELQNDLARRIDEREFPTCPPRKLDGDRRLTFINPNDGQRYFHHGGQFALTRWTNLYFPVSQLLWGDAIGGPVGALFGDPPDSNVADLPVYTNGAKRDNFFAHVLYWDVQYGRDAPHIAALKQAIDLADIGTANKL